MRARIRAILVPLAGALSLSPAEAGTWRVGRAADGCDGLCHFHDGNSEYPSWGIRQAMQSLEVLPGDTVMVWPGEYGAKFEIKSGVVLTSRFGPEVTVIKGNAGGEPACFMVGTDEATELLGFTITWDATPQGFGGAVGAYVSSGVIRDNIFRSSASGLGSGVYLQACDLIVQNNLFLSNNTYSGGGALAIDGGAPIIRNNTFSSNFAPFGYEGAAVYVTGSEFTFDRNIVHNSQGASAVFCGGGNGGSITCNLFWHNPLGAFAGQCVDSVGTSGNVGANPLFCDAPAGDFGVCADSPAAVGPCGAIGYVSPTGNCPACLPTSVAAVLEATTWGRLKASYRD